MEFSSALLPVTFSIVVILRAWSCWRRRREGCRFNAPVGNGIPPWRAFHFILFVHQLLVPPTLVIVQAERVAGDVSRQWGGLGGCHGRHPPIKGLPARVIETLKAASEPRIPLQRAVCLVLHVGQNAGMRAGNEKKKMSNHCVCPTPPLSSHLMFLLLFSTCLDF